MNYIIKLVKEYKRTTDDEIFEKIVSEFQALFLKYLKGIPKFYKEDVYQEMLFILFKVINKFEIEEKTIDDKYSAKLIQKYKINNENQITYEELSLFYNENQFIKYLDKALNNKIISFFRENKEELYIKKINLNDIIYENIEMIDTIPDLSTAYESPFDKYDFDEKEMMFVNSFIEKGQIILEKEVAKKLKITQQAVNKRKRKLIDKYKNF